MIEIKSVSPSSGAPVTSAASSVSVDEIEGEVALFVSEHPYPVKSVGHPPENKYAPQQLDQGLLFKRAKKKKKKISPVEGTIQTRDSPKCCTRFGVPKTDPHDPPRQSTFPE